MANAGPGLSVKDQEVQDCRAEDCQGTRGKAAPGVWGKAFLTVAAVVRDRWSRLGERATASGAQTSRTDNEVHRCETGVAPESNGGGDTGDAFPCDGFDIRVTEGFRAGLDLVAAIGRETATRARDRARDFIRGLYWDHKLYEEDPQYDLTIQIAFLGGVNGRKNEGTPDEFIS